MQNETAAWRLWAKSDPFHLLWRHLLDAAAVCRALLPRFGDIPPLPASLVCYLVALHDIGKADVYFQNKDEDLANALRRETGLLLPSATLPFRHEARSREWAQSHLYDWNIDKSLLETVVKAIQGHHGNFSAGTGMGELPDEDEFPARLEVWSALRTELATLLRGVIGVRPHSLNSEACDASVVGIRLSGLIVLCDWIASNDHLFPFPELAARPDADNPAVYYAAACREAERVVHDLELDVAYSPFQGRSEPLRFADVWSGSGARFSDLRPAQVGLEKACCDAGTPLPPGLAIIEAPMGEGKTEAAIYLAEEWNRQRNKSGLYVALPTQATSNQMHARYDAYLSQRRRAAKNGGNLTEVARQGYLVHGMAWLIDARTPPGTPETHGDHDETEGEEAARAREWFQNAKRALIAPEGVGTVDQALTAALNVRHGFLRLFGLSAKTLIIDEVHAYDIYMTTLMCRLLAWCRALEIPVILLSATLSKRQKQMLIAAYQGENGVSTESADSSVALEPYPLLTFAPLGESSASLPRAISVPDDPGRHRIVRLVSHPGFLGDPAAIARLAIDRVEKGGCVCVLVNTVSTAQETYRALLEIKRNGDLPPDTKLLLFHARFRAERRQEIEQEVTRFFGKAANGDIANPERPERAIVVATQVVEQSLDVDFDAMLTQIAPVDLLLQRSGRLWRHDRGPARPNGDTLPILDLLLPPPDGKPDFGVSQYVYARETLLRTLRLLETRTEFRLPADFRPLIEGCYGGDGDDAPEKAGKEQLASQVTAADLAEAKAKRLSKQAGDAKQALTHLVPPPSATVFTYAQTEKAVDEADENTKGASYFRAQTRLGDDTRAVLVLSEPDTIKAFRKAQKTAEDKKGSDDPKDKRWAPGRYWLCKFFIQKVNLRSSWVSAMEAAKKSEEVNGKKETPPTLITDDGPRWLRHHAVVILQNGVWQKGGVTLRDDHDLGLIFMEDKPAAANAEPDADT